MDHHSPSPSSVPTDTADDAVADTAARLRALHGLPNLVRNGALDIGLLADKHSYRRGAAR
ncbi:hypothetical protein [Actinacidiphila acididurans]|uniref:Uncharacterized protein n=1 Tax=Actinacidiphila acididurans TaxID=2784346 RepID=A0ABS2U2R3_9ACTN|nr:hypothetical protein [Actinacidiphila acididurans]MBM9509652.1 hypothetical protein [Actinacidiphila acididurans]